MLFWIISAIIVILAGWGWWTFINDRYGSPETLFGFIMSIIGSLALAAVGVGLAFIVTSVLANAFNSGAYIAKETEQNLVALQTRESEEGRFGGSIFASYGYVDGVRVLSYISEGSDGGFRTDYAEAVNSVVYQSDETPKIVTYEWEKSNGWLSPFAVGAGTSYAFTVPDGSVVDGYEVSP